MQLDQLVTMKEQTRVFANAFKTISREAGNSDVLPRHVGSLMKLVLPSTEIAPRVTLLEPQLTHWWLVSSIHNERNIAEWRNTTADVLDKTQGRENRPAKAVTFREKAERTRALLAAREAGPDHDEA